MCSSRQFVDRRGYLIGLMSLVCHRLFRALRLAGHRADQPGQLSRGVRNLLNQRMDFLNETIEGPGQLAQLVTTRDGQAMG